jgi:hypothetical protein
LGVEVGVELVTTERIVKIRIKVAPRPMEGGLVAKIMAMTEEEKQAFQRPGTEREEEVDPIFPRCSGMIMAARVIKVWLL